MAKYFYADIGSGILPIITMEPINKGDNKLYFKVFSSGEFELYPNAKIKAIITASGISSLSNPSDTYSVSGLVDRIKSSYHFSDDTNGIYSVVGGENNTASNQNVTFNDVIIYSGFENYPFDIHWLFIRGSSEIYGSISGIYSNPHNIQNSEIYISGILNNSNSMSYNIKWNTINNEGSSRYNPVGNVDGPYRVKVLYHNDVNAVTTYDDWTYYPSGTMISGITISLPFNDSRTGFPAFYDFYITNVSASDNKPGTSDKIISIDHNEIKNSDIYFHTLDSLVSRSAVISDIRKVDEILVEPNIIDRRRISIGINDIVLKNNIYSKQGVYVSKSYPLDKPIYTLSLKVDEFLPDYSGINYEMLKYFIEINSEWYPISPINRTTETENSIIIPKLYIFDSGIDDSYVKYINLSNVRSIRLKIVFDLSTVGDSFIISPEVRDYKFIIYSKEDLNKL